MNEVQGDEEIKGQARADFDTEEQLLDQAAPETSPQDREQQETAMRLRQWLEEFYERKFTPSQIDYLQAKATFDPELPDLQTLSQEVQAYEEYRLAAGPREIDLGKLADAIAILRKTELADPEVDFQRLIIEGQLPRNFDPDPSSDTNQDEQRSIIKADPEKLIEVVYQLAQLYDYAPSPQVIRELVSEAAFPGLKEKAQALAKYDTLVPKLDRSEQAVLLRQLLDMVAEKGKSPDEQKKLAVFVANVHEVFFSHSPNLTDSLPIQDQLFLTARANRIPEAQGWLGQDLVGEVAENLVHVGPEWVKDTGEKIEKLPIGERLDVIDQLKTIGAAAIAHGSHTEASVDRVLQLLEHIKDADQSPIIRYAVTNAKQRLKQEYQNPTLGVVTYHGNVAHGRLAEKAEQEILTTHMRLAGQINPDVAITRGNLARISSDAVAVIDQGYLPQKIGRVDLERLPQPGEISIIAVRNSKHDIAEYGLGNPRELATYIAFINNRMLFPQKGGGELTTDAAAEKWVKISEIFSREQWAEYFEVAFKKQQWENEYREAETRLTSEAEVANEQASQEFLEHFTSLAPQVIAAEANHRARKYLQSLLAEFQVQQIEKNLERMFTAAERFVAQFRNYENLDSEQKTRSNLSEEAARLFDDHEYLLEFHRQTWDNMQAQLEELGSFAHHPQRTADYRRYLALTTALTKQAEQLSADMLKYLAELEEQLSARAVPVHFESIDQLSNNREINPFAETSEQDLALLLQHLHKPELRSQIEGDLGIKFLDIPLRSQIHFLRFLAGQDKQGFTRLREVLQKHPDSRPEILQSFLANAESLEYGEVILDLAEQLQSEDAQKLFAAYAQYAQRLDHTAAEIRVMAQQVLPGSALPREQILASLITHANSLLSQARKEQDIEKIIAGFAEDEKALQENFQAFSEAAHDLREYLATHSQANAAEIEKFQRNFEAKFQDLVLREQKAKLPDDVFADLDKEAQELYPEKFPAKEPVYFPVGISKELENWERVWRGELVAGKPIDLYGYLFWLNNQGRSIELVICDEMQRHNYLPPIVRRHGLRYNAEFVQKHKNREITYENEAISKAQKVGDWERQQYQQIIETFDLKNLKLQTYQEFLDQSGREEFTKYAEFCQRLSQEPIWRQAFADMLQESAVEEGETAEERAKHLTYAIEEVAWILATDGVKISHQKEARYDALAAVISNMEIRLREDDKGNQIPGRESLHAYELFAVADKQEIIKAFDEVVAALLKKTNDEDLKEARHRDNSEAKKYFENSLAVYRTLRESLKESIPKDERTRLINRQSIYNQRIRKLEMNFAIARAGAQSLGWQEKGKGEVSTASFREPYSTYFYHHGAEVFLNSTQVVAVPQGLIGGRVLALDQRTQAQYAREVIRPLLVNYFKTLEDAPPAYFQKVGKPRQELLREAESAKTLLESIKFVQKYVVEPTAGKE